MGKAQLAVRKRARAGPAAHYGAGVAVYAAAQLPCGAVALLYSLAAVNKQHFKIAVLLKKLQRREYSRRTRANDYNVVILCHGVHSLPLWFGYRSMVRYKPYF